MFSAASKSLSGGAAGLKKLFAAPGQKTLGKARSLCTPASSDAAASNTGLWSAYLRALEQRPILTKAITSGCLTFTADVICQVCAPNKEGLRALKAKHTSDSATATATAVDSGNGNSGGEMSLHELQLRLSLIDGKRLAIFTGLGVCYIAPCLHFWYVPLLCLPCA